MIRLCGLMLCALLASAVQRPKILGIAEVAYGVSDSGAAQEFYGGILGLQPVAAVGGWLVPVNPSQRVRLSTAAKPGQDRFRSITFSVESVPSMRQWLSDHGIAVLGVKELTMTDPEGHTIHFRERDTSGPQTPDGAVSNRLLHTGIHVRDARRASKFYVDVLGFRELWRGSSDDKTLSWINLAVPDGTDYIEYMLYRESPPQDRLGGMHHICLEVPNLAAAYEQLQKRPARATYKRAMEVRTGRNRRRQLNLFDADGTRTELMEPKTVDGVPAPNSQAPLPE